jgi:hypothetical protein
VIVDEDCNVIRWENLPDSTDGNRTYTIQYYQVLLELVEGVNEVLDKVTTKYNKSSEFNQIDKNVATINTTKKEKEKNRGRYKNKSTHLFRKNLLDRGSMSSSDYLGTSAEFDGNCDLLFTRDESYKFNTENIIAGDFSTDALERKNSGNTKMTVQAIRKNKQNWTCTSDIPDNMGKAKVWVQPDSPLKTNL